MIAAALGDGSRFGARIRYSPESPPLETAGGVANALHFFGDEPFALVSSDIHTEFDYARLAAPLAAIARDPASTVAHFVLVDNPPWHAAGDMGLDAGRVTRGGPRLTYGNISVFHPAIFREIAPGTWLKLFPWAYRHVEAGRVTGEHFRGPWDNVGTPAQLAALDGRLAR
jgi:MurNAc alpha-1-phosphate uridylyltransferase